MTIWIVELFMIWIFYFLCFHTTFGKVFNRKKLFLSFTLTMMMLVLGLRSNFVGEDTNHYVEIFNKSTDIMWFEIFTKLRIVWRIIADFNDEIENGFLFIAKFTHIFTDNPQLFLLAIAALTMAGFGKFIYDNSEDVFFSVYILMCECLYMSAFNGARQILAVSIGINAYTLMQKKRFIKALAIITLAIMVHNSAAVFLLTYVVFLLKTENHTANFKRFKYFFAFCASIVCILPFINWLLHHLLPRYTAYFSNNYWEINVGGTMLLWIIELGLIFYMYNRHFYKNNAFELSALVLVYLTLEIISFRYSIFGRLAWYYRGFLLLFLPMSIEGIKERKNRQIIKYVLFVLLTLAFISYGRVDSRNYSFFLTN